MEEKEKAVGANAKNAKGDANPNGANPNAKKKDEEKKKKAGVVIGIVGLSVAAAIAAAAGAKGCAPNERSYTVTYLTDDEVQNFQGGSVNVKEGTTIGDLKRQLAPLDGYEVEGFYKDPDCTLEFRDEEKVNDDTKIYIEYKEIEITLIFHNDNNPNDNSFENMTVKYFDNLSKLTMPAPESYTSSEGSYTFKCWKTRDGKVVDLKSMTNGKDLLEIDADGEIDLYAEFEFEKVKSFGLNFDSSKVRITKNGKELTPQDRVYADDELVVDRISVEGDWVYAINSITGLELYDYEDLLYIVKGDCDIEITNGEIEHRYLTFTLKDDQTYEVKGMTDEAIGLRVEDIVIPDNHFDKRPITSIGDNAFYDSDIYTIVIGDNILSIGKYAFDESGVHHVTIGKKVASIGDYAFRSCNGLRSIEIPSNVKSIGDYAFYFSELNSVTLNEGLLSIGESAFESCDIEEITIPNSVNSVGYGAFRDNGLNKVTLGPNNPHMSFDERGIHIYEVTYLGSTKEWIENGISSNFFESDSFFDLYTTDGLVTSYEFTEDVPNNALSYVKSLKTVTFSDNVKRIGWWAFACSGVTNINWGNGVTYIGDHSFESCDMTELVIPDSVTEIDIEAFSYCLDITNLVIGSNVKDIDEEAFSWHSTSWGSDNKIQSITIKSSEIYKNLDISSYEGEWIRPLIRSGLIVKVDENVVDNYKMPSYLKNEFTKSANPEDGYYIFTKK